MIASNICEELYGIILGKNLKGRIHSVFDNSFNVLDQDNRLISFLGSKKPMSPRSIKLQEEVSFLDLGIEQGLELEFHDEFVLIKQKNIKIIYDKAILWGSKPNLSFDKELRENVSVKVNKMGAFLQSEGKKDGIFPLLKTLEGKIEGIEFILDKGNPLGRSEEFIKDRFLAFIDSYIRQDIEEISLRAKNIVGFGIGLTPSMDDFLSGIMVSGIYLSYYLNQDTKKVLEFNNAIVKDIRNRTTMVSEEMLMFSSRGEVNDDVRKLMVSLLSTNTIEIFPENLKKVADFGETSGTDMISGIYIGSCIILN